MTWIDLLIVGVASWRLAFMLTRETGPFAVFERLRTRYPLGGLMTCIYCASVWTALACYALYMTPLIIVVYVLAVSAVGLMLAAYSGANHN